MDYMTLKEAAEKMCIRDSSYGEHKYKMLGKSVQNFMPMDKQISQVLQKKLEAQGFQVINYC